MHLSRVHVAGQMHLVNATTSLKNNEQNSGHMHLSRVHVGYYIHLVKWMVGLPQVDQSRVASADESHQNKNEHFCVGTCTLV